MVKDMDSIEKIRKWLLQFRTVIYTRDRSLDLDLLETEIKEANRLGLLDQKMYHEALLTIRRERRKLEDRSEG